MILFVRFGRYPHESSLAPWSVTATGSDLQSSVVMPKWQSAVLMTNLSNYGMLKLIKLCIHFMTTMSELSFIINAFQVVNYFIVVLSTLFASTKMILVWYLEVLINQSRCGIFDRIY